MSRIRDERGMSLVEMMASLTIFAIITVGLTPLLAASLRGSNLSRSYTVAKDAAQQGMERARGLPYYVSYQSQTKKVDVLDTYFPCADKTLASTACAGEATRSYNDTTGVYTQTCVAGVTGPTCAVPLPAGYSLKYEARFVRPDGTTTVLPPTTPPTTYKRNPNFTTEGQLDTPPSQLLELSVTAQWTVAGKPKSYLLRTIIGDRKFGDVKLAAVGRVNYSVQVLTSYAHTVGDARTSDLKVVAGNAESRIEQRLVSNAIQRVRPVEITLIRRATDIDPLAADIRTPIQGPIAEFRAPPNQAPTVADAPDGTINQPQTMTHPNVVIHGITSPAVAFVNATSATGLNVSVANELPSAAGAFSLLGTGLNTGYLRVDNQADTANDALLRLDPFLTVFSMRNSGGALTGNTSAISTGLGAGRKVESRASMNLGMLRLFPTTFINEGSNDERYVVLIKDFSSTMTCISNGSAPSTATGSWTATLKYWRDNDPLNGITTDVDLEPVEITITGALAQTNPDLSTVINGGVNPLVYDGLLPTQDVYLFKTTLQNGYLSSLRISQVVISSTGIPAAAGVDAAISITTAPTNPLLPESGINVSIGSLGCEALDRR